MIIKIPKTNIAIGDGQPVFSIAEIGKGFIQSKEDKPEAEYLQNAKVLIKAAKESGATAVKFQTHCVEDEQADINVVSPHFLGSDRYNWVKRNTEIGALEFWQEIKKYSEELDILFFSTPMSRGAAKMLQKLDVPLWKVGSGDILDFVLLDYLASTGKPIIISSGMSNLEETDQAIKFLKERTDQIVLMHCVSLYPCPPEKLNLGTIKFFKERYGILVGFSSHTIEWQSSVEAVYLGASVLEKHFTMDRNLWGSDHRVSLLPNEFKDMVQSLQKGDRFKTNNFGQDNKVLQEEEAVFRPLYRKTLVVGQDLPKGTVITKDMVYAMRPQIYLKGLPSEKFLEVVGKKAARDLKKYEPLNSDMIK